MTATKIISSELLALGYKKHNNLYIRKVNDIISIYSFEKPNSALYIHYAIIPLFIPNPGFVYLTFGSRFNEMFSDVSINCNLVGQEEIIWTKRVINHIYQDTEPFTNEVATLDGMERWMHRHNEFHIGDRFCIDRYFRCTSDEYISLELYYCIYKKNYSRAKKYAKKYISSIKAMKHYTEELKSTLTKDAENIIDLIEEEQYEKLDELCQNRISTNMTFYSLK